MMRILWVKAGKLLPVDTGGKIRSFNILRELARNNDVTLLTYYGGKRDEDYEEEIRDRFPGAVTIHTAASEAGRLGRALDYLRRLPRRAPYAVTKFHSPDVEQWLTQRMGGDRFDVAVCDFLSATLNFPERPELPTVLFQHNVESILWRRQAAHEPNPVHRLAFKIEAAKMARYERRAVNRFHHIIAVSGQDREQMARMTDAARISVVPTGVDLKQFTAALGARAARPVIVFVGSMDWEANIDGVDFFCRDVWPQVKRAVPAARLRLVGRNPHARVARWADDSIEVTGTVPSVIEHYEEAMVNIVPLRIGGGTRLKIYEAMAMRKATVSTAVGAEGLDVEDGRDILLADDAAGFAGAIIRLVRDDALRCRIEDAAARKAAQYDWSIISGRFAETLAQVAEAARAKAAGRAARASSAAV
jgi:polysaccharide biosynthesis protein PslH